MDLGLSRFDEVGNVQTYNLFYLEYSSLFFEEEL